MRILFRCIYQFTYLIQYHYIIATYIFNVCSCVLFCMCESGGLAMSLADSGHLAEGFRDRQCLLSTITPILVPCLRCPCHSPGSPFTPEETLWNGREMTDGMSGIDGTKERVQEGSRGKKKNSLLSLGQTKQTHIIILLGKDPNQYLVTDKASRFDICCCYVLRLITHHQFSVSVYRKH